jgi:hypothetical protein
MKKRIPTWAIVVGIALLAGGMVAVNVLGERSRAGNVAAEGHDHDGDGKADHGAGAH